MLKLFKTFTKTEWLLCIAAVLCVCGIVWLELTIPDYMSEITVLVQTEGSQMSDIIFAAVMMIICAIGSLLFSVAVAVLSSRVAANFSARLRSRLFNRVQEFSLEEIGRFSTASLITRSTNDVTQVQNVIVMGLQAIIKAPITCVWAICKISNKAWQWTFSTAMAVVVLVIVVGTCMLIAIPKFRALQRLTDDLNRVTRENLNGLHVVRAYNAEKYQEAKFEGANTALTDANLFANRTMAFMNPGIQLVNSGLSLAVYWIGAFIIAQAAMMDRIQLFSDMVVFLSYAMQVVMSFMMLIMIFMIIPRAQVAATRINEVLGTKAKIKDGTVTESDPARKGTVEFKNVSFRYPGADEAVIENISFTANRGETVAFIGATGCGKSTVINLIPRFYDVTEGQVLVDGVDVRDYTQKALRNKIGYVSQKAVLFAGTVRSNIAYGDNGRGSIQDSDVVDAVFTAQASEFVEKLPKAYDGRVAQGGSNFSGGQKQRLSIARAIARHAEILIFDDSFSALDYKTDRVLRDALKKECAGATRLIVAQRIGTIRDADRIVVLEKGRVAGIGTHRELMETCEVYQEIALSQLSKEELA